MFRRFRRAPRQLEFPGMAVPRPSRLRATSRAHPLRRARLSLVTAPISRRRFLSRALGWVTAAIAVALGAPAVAAVVSPALRKGEDQWSPIGRLGDPEPGAPDLTVEGTPLLTYFTSLVQDAYLQTTPQDVAVFVVNRGGGEFTVFDVRCTHLGCPVTWEEGDQTFLSPCHDGVFDVEGRVLGGPPPRPLDRYEYKVEDGVLFAGALYRVDDELRRTTP